MIVPITRTRSVRIAPNAAALRTAGCSDSGDLALPELLGAAMDRIQKLHTRQPPTRELRCRAGRSLSRDCHHSRRLAVNVGERKGGIIGWLDRVF